MFQSDYFSLEEALRQILRVNLEARLVLCEIRRAGANFEIDSPLTGWKEREKLIKLRDMAVLEWGEVMTQLEELKAASMLPEDASSSTAVE